MNRSFYESIMDARTEIPLVHRRAHITIMERAAEVLDRRNLKNLRQTDHGRIRIH